MYFLHIEYDDKHCCNTNIINFTPSGSLRWYKTLCLKNLTKEVYDLNLYKNVSSAYSISHNVGKELNFIVGFQYQ